MQKKKVQKYIEIMKNMGITQGKSGSCYNQWLYTYNNETYWIVDLADYDDEGNAKFKASVYEFTLNDDNKIVDNMADTTICSNIKEFKKCLSNSIKHIKQLHIKNKLKVINEDFENK